MKALTIAIVLSIASKSLCWENVPKIPTNRRSQFYLRHDDGAYKYGYDSGNGIAANQVASGDNQVEGFYSFTDESGKLVKVKYTSGVQGFVPEVDGVSQSQVQSRTQSNAWSSQNQESSHQFQAPSVVPLPPRAAARNFVQQQEDNSNSDASYQISFNTGEHAREEKSDSSGNVQGRYSYVDEAGEHDLSYVAGPETGFKVVGGSLATANGLGGKSFESRAHQKSWSQAPIQVNSGVAAKSWQSSNVQTSQPSSDGSYSFSYNTGDHSRTESADANGNVQGKFAYTDEAGSHDLSYVAGADSGFVVTGGSLATANGLAGKSFESRSQQKSWSQAPAQSGVAGAKSWQSTNAQTSQPSSDGSYSFSYNTGDQSRTESADANGNVQGKFAYTDEAGNHDLSYVAGADSGFVVTGGSLATANGLAGKSFESRSQQKSWSQAPAQSGVAGAKSWQSTNAQTSQPSSDGSYSFSYNTGDHSRTESADANGNIQGKFAYSDEAGNHDLSYVAGADSGFVVTGGSLATANGLAGKSFDSRSHQKSWSQAPAQSGVAAAKSWQSSNVQTSQPSSDGSYSFSYNTGDQSRTESADANGNVQGKFAYTDEAGNHDLSYVAGADSGFVVTGGSLATANGLAGKSFDSRSQQKSWSQAPAQSGVAAAKSWQSTNVQTSQPSSDGSYSFSYNTGDQSRQESSDGSGRVQGGYAVQTDGGHQQLKFDFGNSGSSSRGFSQSQSVNTNNQNSHQQQSSQGTLGTWTEFGGKTRAYNTDASVHPTFTVITPSSNQRSLDYGPKNAVILGYLPPRHAEKHGYIYDTQN